MEKRGKVRQLVRGCGGAPRQLNGSEGKEPSIPGVWQYPVAEPAGLGIPPLCWVLRVWCSWRLGLPDGMSLLLKTWLCQWPGARAWHPYADWAAWKPLGGQDGQWHTRAARCRGDPRAGTNSSQAALQRVLWGSHPSGTAWSSWGCVTEGGAARIPELGAGFGVGGTVRGLLCRSRHTAGDVRAPRWQCCRCLWLFACLSSFQQGVCLHLQEAESKKSPHSHTVLC